MKAGTATGEEDPVEELRVEPQAGLAEHTGKLIKRSLIGEGITEYILLRVVIADVAGAGKLSLAGEVILLPLALIANHGVGFVYLFKPLFGLPFVARVSVRVVLEGKLSKGLLYLLLTGVFRNAEDLIVVFHIVTWLTLVPVNGLLDKCYTECVPIIMAEWKN